MTVPEFTLGTVQLGLAYGIANKTGMPSRDAALQIVRQAIEHGVRSLDTARAYGEAESRVGEALDGVAAEGVRVVTKLGRLDDLAPDAPEPAVRLAVEESVGRSREELRFSRLQTLLLHNWAHRFSHGGAVWRRLLEMQSEGEIEVLGASVYSPDEAVVALNDPTIGHLQIPFNMLDWRWKAAGVDALALRRKDVCIHARSALLQGLLSADRSTWARVPGAEPERWLGKLERLAVEFGREDRADLCFAYVRSQPWIASTVVGVETMAQLDTNLRLFTNPLLTLEQCDRAEQELAGASEDLLNPSRWKAAN